MQRLRRELAVASPLVGRVLQGSCAALVIDSGWLEERSWVGGRVCQPFGGVYVAEKAAAPVHTELADRRKGVPHKHNRLID